MFLSMASYYPIQDQSNILLTDQPLAKAAVVDSRSEIIRDGRLLWNLLAYLGLQEFSIREESSSEGHGQLDTAGSASQVQLQL